MLFRSKTAIQTELAIQWLKNSNSKHSIVNFTKVRNISISVFDRERVFRTVLQVWKLLFLFLFLGLISFFIFSLLIHLKHYFCIGTILNMLELFQTYLKHSKYIRNIPKSNYNYSKYIRAIPNMLEIFQMNSKSLEKSSKTSNLAVMHLKPFKSRFEWSEWRSRKRSELKLFFRHKTNQFC